MTADAPSRLADATSSSATDILPIAQSKVVAIALNTSLYPDDDEARRVIADIAAETGLPADDPVRFGADRLWPVIRDAVDGLPWV